MSIFAKVREASEAVLDAIIEKAKTSASDDDVPRKGVVDLSYPEDEQYGYKERPGMIGDIVLKNMSRKDSVVRSIISTRISQVRAFCKPQKTRYDKGWVIEADEPADLSDEDKLKLADPTLQDEQYDQLRYEMDQKLSKIKEKQKKEIEEICRFLTHSGVTPEETDTTHKRWDLEKFVTTVVEDRLTYNYMAVELIPTRDGSKLHHYYPISAGTIKYISQRSAEMYEKILKEEEANRSRINKRFDKSKPLKYVQKVRGKIVAAFTEDELIFEAAKPTVDPEDNSYSPGELEFLLNIVTAHLFAEAHNRNFFTQGIGTKGILHIKGNNISRAQLEGFKRQWFNQVVNTRNAFRPPIIGMADEVKWVELAQSNKEMEFEQWMNYLIKICCAIYQIDPAEINFDISKNATAQFGQQNPEQKLQQSKDKGLQPLLAMVETIFNNHILRYWNKDYATRYKFRFVGFEAESRQQEIDRLQKECQVWKTLNEARIEMGKPPLEHGNIVLNATFTQYLAQKDQAAQQAQQPGMPGAAPGEEGGDEGGNPADEGMTSDMNDLNSAIDEALGDAGDEKDKADKEAKEKAAADEKKKADEAKKSTIEYVEVKE